MRKRFAKLLIYFFLACVLLIVTGTGAIYLYRNRNAEVILPKEEITYSDPVAFFQQDERWKDDNLGDSKYKMGDSGCLTTCLTSMVIMQNITVSELDEITPKTLNAYFSENGVYDSEGDLDWIKAGNVLGVEFTRREPSELSENEVDDMLKNAVYPIVCVRTDNGNYHFVLIVGSDESNYLCMDPMNEDCEITPLSKFDDKIYSVRYSEE